MVKRFGQIAVLAGLLFTGSGCSTITTEKRIRHPVTADYSIEDPQFRDSIGELAGNPIVDGNNVVELVNGDQIFPAMLEAIRGAKKTIVMEMYIWSSGKASDPFVDAVCERARAGVKVHLLVDAVGSFKLWRKDIRRMEKAGAVIAKYNRPISFKFFRTNFRTHRKILVVDGRIGFTGGVCINDEWLGNAEPGHWRDTHLRVEGPVVSQMQGVIMENWMQTRSEVLHGDGYFPGTRRAGSMAAQFIKSGPREGSEMTRLSYLLSFAAARKIIRISHAYFAPDSLMIDTLVAARKRGVRVQIIVPKKTDNFAIATAAKPRWEKLLKAGVEFYLYQPTLYHCKIVIVDDVWSIVGSVNFDERSFRINDEANLQVMDKDFAAQLVKSFEDDKAKSQPFTYEDFKKRPFWSKIFDRFAGLFSSQL